MLTGERKTSLIWSDPWKEAVRWLPEGEDPSYRLNSLYRKLVGFALLKDGDSDAAKKMGVSPTQQARLKELSLDCNKAYATICEISAWRSGHTNPYICALKISAIWS